MIDKIELAHQGEHLKFSDFEFGAGFPAEWGFVGEDGQNGKLPDDAGTLYVTIGHSGSEIYEDGLTIKFTLQDIVEDIFEGANSNGVLEGVHAEDAKRVIQRLRDAADFLEQRLAKQ